MQWVWVTTTTKKYYRRYKHYTAKLTQKRALFSHPLSLLLHIEYRQKRVQCALFEWKYSAILILTINVTKSDGLDVMFLSLSLLFSQHICVKFNINAEWAISNQPTKDNETNITETPKRTLTRLAERVRAPINGTETGSWLVCSCRSKRRLSVWTCRLQRARAAWTCVLLLAGLLVNMAPALVWRTQSVLGSPTLSRQTVLSPYQSPVVCAQPWIV